MGVINSMILVDSQIKQLIAQGKLIKDEYKVENVNSISYDLTIDKVLISKDGENNKEINSFSLKPGQFVYIKTKEKARVIYLMN